MGEDTKLNCTCGWKKFLRRFTFVCALGASIVALWFFQSRLRSQFFGRDLWVLFGELLAPVVLSFVFSLMIFRSGKRSGWAEVSTVLLMLAVFLSVFSFAYSFLSGDSLATFYGEGQSGVLSVYEAMFVWLICLVAIIIQLSLINYDRLYRQANVIVGGSLAVVGILMSKLLESYEVLRAYCYAASCGMDLLLMIAQYEIAASFVLSLLALFVAGVFLPMWRTWLYGLFDGTTPCLICGRNARENIVQPMNAGLCKDSEGGLGDVTSASDLEEPTAIVESAPLAVGAMRGDALSRQLTGAAVSGVVAGVCFSVISGLFNRR